MSLFHESQVFNKHLSKLAQGFTSGEVIADQLLPVIRTDKAEFTYLSWDKSAFVLGDHLRGESADTKMDDFGFERKSAKLPIGYSASVMVDRRVDRQTIGVNSLLLAKQKIKLKQGLLAREFEKKAAAIITTVGEYAATNHGNVSNAGSGGWGDPDTDIFADILTGAKAIQDTLGVDSRKLKLLITPDVAIAMRKNNILKSYFLNTTAGAAAFKIKALAEVFDIADIVVGFATHTDPADGLTKNIWGSALANLIYVADAPGDGVIDPSALPAGFGWTIQLDGMPLVEEDYSKGRTSDVYYIHDNKLHLKTSNIAGYMFESVLT